MKDVFLILVLISLAFCSCQKNKILIEDDFQLLENQKIIVDAVEREYHLLVPANSADRPLVILLHGHSSDFDKVVGLKANKAPYKVWLELAQEHDFSVVVPNGTLGPEGTRGWNDCRNDAKGNPDIDDVAFISQLLNELSNEYKYDSKRVYVSVISNGASMSSRLAEEMPNRITAFASIVNSTPVNSQCENSTIPISALFMNGTKDPLVPYEGGRIASDRGLVLSTDESIEYWKARNQTDAEPIIETFEDLDNNDNSNVLKYSYENGVNNTEVILYEITGGGHLEPSIKERYSNLVTALLGEQNGDIEMAEEVWEFFKTKSK